MSDVSGVAIADDDEEPPPFDFDGVGLLAYRGYPQVECPRCGIPQTDYDGFGVVRCTACDFCTHASQTRKKGAADFVCDLCGKVMPDLWAGAPKCVGLIDGAGI